MLSNPMAVANFVAGLVTGLLCFPLVVIVRRYYSRTQRLAQEVAARFGDNIHDAGFFEGLARKWATQGWIKRNPAHILRSLLEVQSIADVRHAIPGGEHFYVLYICAKIKAAAAQDRMKGIESAVTELCLQYNMEAWTERVLQYAKHGKMSEELELAMEKDQNIRQVMDILFGALITCVSQARKAHFQNKL